MKKYLQIVKDTWAQYMVYRLNFVMWRVRQVCQMLVTYFLWWAIFSSRNEFFGYTQSMILTYVLLTSVARTVVLGTTTMEIGDLINQGNLSNFLVKPMPFFRYYAARDIADKALNMAFAVVELVLLFILLRPPVFIQHNLVLIALALLATAVAAVLYFFFSMILGFLGFWTPDVWGVRFISFVVMEFFAGGLFPLDILPQPLFVLSQSLPFFYFVYFPLKIYLGQLSAASIATGLTIAGIWTIGLAFFASLVWQRGLRVYTAEGK